MKQVMISEELESVKGGAFSFNATLLNALSRFFEFIYVLGKSLGSSYGKSY